jgi:hypothetical protein
MSPAASRPTSVNDARLQAGARFTLTRTADHGARADYAVLVETVDAHHTGTAVLVDDGTATVEAPGLPEELLATLHMIAKLTARSAPKKREEGLPPWPQRVSRWRGPGRGE